ncbi:hypothetical protein PPL_08661 [Heterostelium album PN500]|uniref:Uncharacterized protein n=1 Tax=Heterostelium pallidum (strain ATCC 26659 / Pp 5 / PN500) TaxID=670386 RepID=D3BJD6_HETP5|nr:hypothetical protein PPL_08661 [Heterostelium album PN500]EFA78016.1 hypothetical protein PPL_08661 [Heterostelium album PN500]|eukprot:XP_020430144.1 hypothetical protein PPL_08661 [Heterostelium album PN500]
MDNEQYEGAYQFLTDQLSYCPEYLSSPAFISFFKVCRKIPSMDGRIIELIEKHIHSIPAEQLQKIGVSLLDTVSSVEKSLDFYSKLLVNKANLDQYHHEFFKAQHFDFTASYIDVVEQWLLRQGRIYSAPLIYLFGIKSYDSPSYQILSLLRDNLEQVSIIIAYGESLANNGLAVKRMMEMFGQSSRETQQKIVERVIYINLHIGRINRVLHWRQLLETPSQEIDYLIARHFCDPIANSSRQLENYWRELLRESWGISMESSAKQQQLNDNSIYRKYVKERGQYATPFEDLFKYNNTIYKRSNSDAEESLMAQLSELAFLPRMELSKQSDGLHRMAKTLDQVCSQEFVQLNFGILLQCVELLYYGLTKDDFKSLWSSFTKKTRYWLNNPNYYVLAIDSNCNDGVALLLDNLPHEMINRYSYIKNAILEQLLWAGEFSMSMKLFSSIGYGMSSERCYRALASQIIDEKFQMDPDDYERFKLQANANNNICELLDCWYAIKRGDIAKAEQLYQTLKTTQAKKRAVITKLGFKLYCLTRQQQQQQIDVFDLLEYIGVTRTNEFYDVLLPELTVLPGFNTKQLYDIIELDGSFYKLFHTPRVVELIVYSYPEAHKRLESFKKFANLPPRYTKHFIQSILNDMNFTKTPKRYLKRVKMSEIEEKVKITQETLNTIQDIYNL